MRSLAFAVGLTSLGTVCLAQASDGDAMDLSSDLHLTLHSGHPGIEYPNPERRSAAAEEEFRYDLAEPERWRLDLDLSDPAGVLFGMFSAVQEETPAVELSEETPRVLHQICTG